MDTGRADGRSLGQWVALAGPQASALLSTTVTHAAGKHRAKFA